MGLFSESLSPCIVLALLAPKRHDNGHIRIGSYAFGYYQVHLFSIQVVIMKKRYMSIHRRHLLNS